jgi:hypothetical protein
MAPALQPTIIDKAEGITRISRGWLVLAYAHFPSHESQLGLFPWPSFRLLDGAVQALAQLIRDEPKCVEKIINAEMELALARRST